MAIRCWVIFLKVDGQLPPKRILPRFRMYRMYQIFVIFPYTI